LAEDHTLGFDYAYNNPSVLEFFSIFKSARGIPIGVQTSDGQTYEANVEVWDRARDIAILKIEAENLPFLLLGKTTDLSQGDTVFTVGNSLGFEASFSNGIMAGYLIDS